MFRRPPEFKVDPEDPFGSDRLGREPAIRKLTKLMNGNGEPAARMATPMVMTLSAPWGSGKSSFIQMWKMHLMDEEGGDHPCIIFDAWKHDFHREPLLAFMGELSSYMKDIVNPNPLLKKKFEQCLEHAPALLNAVGGVGAVAALANPVLAPVVGGTFLVSKTLKDIKKYVTKKYSLQKGSIEGFKKELAEFVKLLIQNDENKRLYFFVDELDRCDPEYAIKLLESIKHFFDVPGMVFVLSVDRNKLGSMVKVRYGDGFDADGYLKRFVDVDYEIPEPKREQLVRYICKDVLELEKYPVGITSKRFDTFVNTAILIADELGMRARDIEKVFIKISPLLVKDFSIPHFKSFGRENGVWAFWGRQGDSIWADEHITDLEIINNFFHPLLVFAFLKEVSREHYDVAERAYTSNVSDEFKETRPKFAYSQLFTLMSETSKAASNSQLLNSIGKDYGVANDACRLAIMLSIEPGYWKEQISHIRAELENLDSITLLSVESESKSKNVA